MSSEKRPTCPMCGKGTLSTQVEDYHISTSEGLKFIVPNLKVEVCDLCAEKILPLESALQVEHFIAEKNEQLTPIELRKIRTELGVDQTEMSEVLGLGSKTFHRWEKGLQVPSRSMGYYLRLLKEFPASFEWLQERGWREKKIISIDFKASFPALHALPQKEVSQQKRNAALALFGS